MSAPTKPRRLLKQATPPNNAEQLRPEERKQQGFRQEAIAAAATEDAQPSAGIPAQQVIKRRRSLLQEQKRATGGPTIMLELPAGELPPDVYHKRFFKVELVLARDKQLAASFQQLFYSLNQRDIRLTSGRHIDSGADALRWLLEQYHAATHAASGAAPTAAAG